jgi:hypothetical protein
MTGTYFFSVLVSNAELVRIWGKEGEMAMQFLHLSYASGGVIAPLATEPFLTPIQEDDLNVTSFSSDSGLLLSYNSSLSLGTWSNISTNGSLNVTLGVHAVGSEVALPQTTIVYIAFIICAVLLFIVCFAWIYEWYTDHAQKKKRQDSCDEEGRNEQPLSCAMFFFVCSVLLFFNFMYCAMEDTFPWYFTQFAVDHLQWSKACGAQVTSLYLASFAFFRFGGIFLARYLSRERLAVASVSMLVLSYLSLVLFSLFRIDIGVWVSSACVGASMAPIFAATFMWMDAELIRASGPVTSAIMIACALGSTSNPTILGFLMFEVSSMWFVYLLLLEAALSLFALLFLIAFSHLYLKQHFARLSKGRQEVKVEAPCDGDLKEEDSCVTDVLVKKGIEIDGEPFSKI